VFTPLLGRFWQARIALANLLALVERRAHLRVRAFK